MKKIFIVILIVVILGFVLIKFNFVPGISGIFSASRQENPSAIYLCPMHPTYTSTRPGDCPICGMRLVKKEAKKQRSKEAKDSKIVFKKSSSQLSGIEIDPVKEQYLGIKTTKAKLKEVQKEIKALGIVALDETKLAHIHTKFSGYIQKVFANYEGKWIKKGEPLFTIYSPELVSTQEEYLLALEAEEKLKNNKFPEIVKSQTELLEGASKRFELWDISSDQIEKLKSLKQITKDLTFYSPVSGFITKREAFEGAEITPETTLYDIVDLSHVWVLVEVYENDLPYVTLGQLAKVNFQYENIKPLTGKITYIYPTVERATRTTKVRLEVNNPDFKLKPNMYVNAVILTNLGKQIIVPTRAVIDSGKRQIVFVKSNEGRFTPKEIKPGPEVNDERVILSGLNEGDEIVTDGNFLLDSESNIQTALEQMKPHSEHSAH